MGNISPETYKRQQKQLQEEANRARAERQKQIDIKPEFIEGEFEVIEEHRRIEKQQQEGEDDDCNRTA